MEGLTCQQIEIVENMCRYVKTVSESIGMHVNVFATKDESSGEYAADAIVRISDAKCVSFHVTDNVVIRRECNYGME